MIKTGTVEKTTKYSLSKTQIEDILLKEAGLARGPGVSIKFDCTGGQDPYEDRYYTPMDLYSATITVVEKSTV
jgi:hypothetical protein